MDDLLEVIGPIVIGVLYLLGNLFSKKDDNESEPEDVPPMHHQRQRPAQDFEDPVPVQQPVIQRQKVVYEAEGFSWDESDDSYDNEMELQLKKIEATKREAARLQSASAQKARKHESQTSRSIKRRKQRSYGSVRSSLQDPSAARSAFIYSEVLGQPVSLRKTSSVPGLTS